RCPDSVLMRHFASAKRAVTIDECPTCGGIWLDAGELERIRSEYSGDSARQQDAQAAIEKGLADDRMALARKQMEEQLPYDVTRSRIASSVLVAIYEIVAFRSSGVELAVKLLMWSIIPWACVCFPEALGDL